MLPTSSLHATAASRWWATAALDMPGFKPNEHYVREMKRYGVLPASFDLAQDSIDVYATDAEYFQSFWHLP